MRAIDKRGLESGTLIKILIAVIVLAVIIVAGLLILYFVQKGEVEVCNNDGVCDAEAGETADNCAGDCGGLQSGEENPDASDGFIFNSEGVEINDIGDGSTGCIQEWQCSDWTDLENECGERECYDVSNCIGLDPMKIELKEC